MPGLKRALRTALLGISPRLWVAWNEFRRAKDTETELTLLPQLVPPNSVTVDVGAHVGLYTRELQNLSSIVYAFEPLSEMLFILCRTVGRNVRVRQIALSSKEGRATLRVPNAGGDPAYGVASLEQGEFREGGGEARVIKTSTLDREVEGHVSFIKIDVEGHELSVLRGAEETISKYRPFFLVESEARHSDGAPQSVAKFFEDRNYAGYFVTRGNIRPFRDFSVDEHQNQAALEADWRLRTGAQYINNFFFFPVESDGFERLSSALNRLEHWREAG